MMLFGDNAGDATSFLDDTWVMKLDCPSGFTAVEDPTYPCRACSRGTFYDPEIRACVPCPGDSTTTDSAMVGDASCTECLGSACNNGQCTSLSRSHDSVPHAVCQCPWYYYP